MGSCAKVRFSGAITGESSVSLREKTESAPLAINEVWRGHIELKLPRQKARADKYAE
jgi:hypothetical protein